MKNRFQAFAFKFNLYCYNSDDLLLHSFVAGASAEVEVPALQYEQYNDTADGDLEMPGLGRSSEASSSQRGGGGVDNLDTLSYDSGIHGGAVQVFVVSSSVSMLHLVAENFCSL